MPNTRSETAKSKATEKTTEPSVSDWSLNTPTETATVSTVTTRSAHTKRMSPQRPPTGVEAPSRIEGDVARPAARAQGGTSPARLPGDITATPTGRRDMRAAAGETFHQRDPTILPTTDQMHEEVMACIAEIERKRQARLEEDAYFASPTPVDKIRVQHAPKEAMRRPDTHSVRSSRRRAEAEAKMQIAKRELEVAVAKSKMAQAELEMIQADSEMEEEEQEVYREQNIEDWFNRSNPQPAPAPPQQNQEKKKSDIEVLAQAITSLSQKASETTLSKQIIELPYFNGASEEWLAFRRSYNDTAHAFTPTQNLARLRRTLQGRARDAVKSLLFTAEDPAEVMKGLEARFGRPGALALSELEKLKSLPRVAENPTEVCTFASQVRNSVATIKALGKTSYLSSPETMKVLIEKMPASMKYRWYIFHRTKREEEQPELITISEFLELEADMCGDFAPPEVSWETKRTRPQHAPQEVPWKNPVKRPVHAVQGREDTRTQVECPKCNGQHWLIECRKFKEADVNERWEIAKKRKICFKCLRFRHARQNCRAPVCKKCSRWHHTILHSDAPPVKQDDKPRCNAVQKEENPVEEVVTSVHTSNNASDGKAYLKMAPVVLYGSEGSIKVLALLDEGSTVTLLDSAVAEKIGAKGKTEALSIEVVGGRNMKKENSQRVSLHIKGVHRRDKKKIEVRTIDGLKLSKQEISEAMVDKCSHLRKLGSQLTYAKEEPRLLIGQDNWGLIITRRIRKGKASEPVTSLTSLGWVLHGCDGRDTVPVKFVNHVSSSKDETEVLVRKHFEIESLGVQPRPPSNDADKRALDVLEKTTTRTQDGRFESGLLWKSEEETLPNNYNQAYRRLINTEKKLDKDEDLKKAYEEQMNQLIINGYAEKAPSNATEGRTFYLPHFAVIHPVKKKPRIVLDAAAKFNGKSLNDVLLPGPDLLQSLFGVLVRFRERPVAVVADIKEMFLRIKMREEDRDSLRFLWRGDKRQGKPEEYRMASVVFGATSSPATAIYVMNKNAEEFKEEYPAAVKAIEKNHYMDDYLQSFGSIEEARKLAKEVKDIHAKAGFNLRGWGSNKPEVLEGIQELLGEKVVELAEEEKTLGLRWLINEDELAFNVGLRNTPSEVLEARTKPTKREVTSAVMSTFDPMGFATPVLIQGKKLIQDIWRTRVEWDEEINDEQMTTWTKYLQEVAILRELEIPRCLSPSQDQGQLHIFSDASEEAYAATVYWRTIEPDGRVHITLIVGKARVTPTKPVSIPRLELQAALLASRLATTVENETSLKIEKKVFWTDSSTVLQWLKSDPRKFNTFVAHRLAEIEELTRPQDWRWVPTKENPADDATRGTPNEFDHTARWFRGPRFLYEDEESWPTRHFGASDVKETGEEKKTQVVAAVKIVEPYLPRHERFSSWKRLVRCTARVLQFIEELKKRASKKKETVTATKKDEDWKPQKRATKKNTIVNQLPEIKKMNLIPIEASQLKRAEEELIKQSQDESFKEEIKCLREDKKIENSSRLRKLDVYLSKEGIVKLRSRTKKIQIKDREANPVILDGRHGISRLIIRYYHEKFLHGNTATVVNEIRQKYWILGLRSSVRKEIYQCQWCKVKKSNPQVPPPGDLPSERLNHHQYPFTSAAVDYFGPMQVIIGRRVEKRWGVLFTCLTTRAVHLELASSLSTSSMIMALRRMAARRGTPKTIFSDNGTNFVGANRELQEAANKEGITWKFIPPGCPNMGGAWERLVRSVKTALMAVLHTKNPPEEVLHTLLTEVEHVVNSRPLTDVSADPEDEESLTPNHFLLGRSCGALSPGEFEDSELVGKATWRTAQRLADHFWKRWVAEYLPTLMPRKITGRETEDPRVGDIVVIMDATLPRNTWPRGEVQQVYPGPDGRVRILDVRTPGGILRRPTRRVIVLVPAAASPPNG